MKQAIGGATGEAAVKARTAAIATIEKQACPDTATTRCQVVTLYGGGQYKLYTYRKYSDVRIVWAPEAAAQEFGGDPDNYNFPRYALDGSFLRAYENGKPVATPAHLQMDRPRPRRGRADLRRRQPRVDPADADAQPVRLPARSQLADRAGHRFRASRAADLGDEAKRRA